MTILTAILTFFFLAALSFGRVTFATGMALSVVGALLVGVVSMRARQLHTGLMYLDILAQKSRLVQWNTGLKTLVCMALLVLCIASNSLWVAGTVLVCMTLVNMASAAVKGGQYFALLGIPFTFVVLSGLVLLIEVSPYPLGMLDLPVFNWYLCVTPQSQARTLLVVAKAFAAVSCLYALSLSTPLFELTALLRQIRVPAVMIELMILMYRYIFILVEALGAMTEAAHSRLGYRTYRCSWRSFTGIASNLLVRSFVQARRCFDAMESRGYDGEIRFLRRRKPLTLSHSLVAAGLCAVPCVVLVVERSLI